MGLLPITVVAKVTKGDRLGTGIRVWHILGHKYLLAKDGIITVTPEVISALSLMVRSARAVLSFMAIRRFYGTRLYREVQANNIIVGDFIEDAAISIMIPEIKTDKTAKIS